VSANVQQAVPFFAVADMQASLRFYIDGLGFTMKHKWIDEGTLRWCWLEIGDAALMLQEFRKEGHDSWTPEGKPGMGVTICFMCLDAITLYREFIGRGIAAQRPFVGNRLWVTSVTDPDGYRLIFESPTDAPEDTELPE
jgi:lactoylglutathione lyase